MDAGIVSLKQKIDNWDCNSQIPDYQSLGLPETFWSTQISLLHLSEFACNIGHCITLAVEIYQYKIWLVLAVENNCAGLRRFRVMISNGNRIIWYESHYQFNVFDIPLSQNSCLNVLFTWVSMHPWSTILKYRQLVQEILPKLKQSQPLASNSINFKKQFFVMQWKHSSKHFEETWRKTSLWFKQSSAMLVFLWIDSFGKGFFELAGLRIYLPSNSIYYNPFVLSMLSGGKHGD